MSNQEIKIQNPSQSAAGIKAVLKATKIAFNATSFSKNLKVFTKLNQSQGIDCPGCAWPDPKKRSKLGEFCENGVKAIAEEIMDQLAGIDFFSRHSVSELNSKSDYWLGQQGRLTHPMIIREGETHYQPISWSEAFDVIGNKLQSLDNPDEAVFYTSGRTSNEAAFLYQLFVRMFGTNNLPDCSNMCHESSGVALNKTLGIGKGSVTLEDFQHAEVILIFGQNPGTNHPRMLTSLEKAKKNGAKIITINPLKEIGLVNFKNPQTVKGLAGAGQSISDLYLQVRINEDVALLKAIMKELLRLEQERGDVLDQGFINSKTEGYESLVTDLEKYELPELINRTGLEKEDISTLVKWLAESDKIIACWAMGLTQHVNAVDNIQEVVNLLLIKGSIGKQGAGTCPVRGHSNVQGDRTMGIWERPTKAWMDKLAGVFDFKPPMSPGYNVVETIQAMLDEKVKVFMALGGNFLPAAPDTEKTAKALRNCDLTIHISTKLNRSHLVHGKTSLILPCLARTDKHIEKSGEQVVTVENSMGIVHTSQGTLTPRAPELKSEPWIVAGIAAKSLKDSEIDWEHLVEDYDRIRELIAKAIAGFEDYNAKLKSSNGFELPNGARVGVFKTPSGKAQFTTNKLSDNVQNGHEFLMMTIRSHDQFNTTVYGLDDRYRGVYNGREVIFMNEQDMADKNFKKGDLVAIWNEYGDTRREIKDFAIVPYDIPKGCVATYFPEANPLIPLEIHARGSHTPASKSVGVNVDFGG